MVTFSMLNIFISRLAIAFHTKLAQYFQPNQQKLLVEAHPHPYNTMTEGCCNRNMLSISARLGTSLVLHVWSTHLYSNGIRELK
jgi:hypothetical protein